MTSNQKLWLKELNRIKRFIRSASKRGYDFSQIKLPTRPKRVTKKSIQLLQGLTPKVLYAKATYRKYNGEIISGTDRRKEERQVAALKAAQTREKTRELKKRIEKYIEENAKPVEDEVIGGADYKEIPNEIIMKDGMAIDPKTGEVLFELDSEGVVFSATDVIENFKQRLKGIDAKSNYYKPLMERWLEILIKVLGEDKVALSLERLAHLDKLIYRAVKYENDFLFFTWEHMNNFIIQGWMDREIAENIMEEFQDNEDEFFSDGVII